MFIEASCTGFCVDASGFCSLAGCVRVCVCMRANARDEHLSLLVLFVTIIYMNDPGAGECLNVYSVIVCLCMCEDVSRTLFDICL